jgi:hypothetical protein
VNRHKAETGVHAALLTLQKAMSDKEFDDMMEQLPDDFRRVTVK